MVTLFLHEGQPGHHFHIALMQELGLPNFRKFGGNNAFTEGWALYAETLGTEMGLYDKPEDYFGHLNDEMLRAVRLVVDTGMHAKGWTREQSIRYMRETLGYSGGDRAQRDERYMAVAGPGAGLQDRRAQDPGTARPRGDRRSARNSACRSSTRSCWVKGRCRWRCWRRRWIAGSQKPGRVDGWTRAAPLP